MSSRSEPNQCLSLDGTKASQEAATVSIADSGFVSGVGTNASLMTSVDSSSPFRAPARAFPIPGTRLKAFKKEGDQASVNHYHDVYLMIEAEIIRKIAAIDDTRTNLIVVRPIVIGEDEAGATLRLTVFCAQHQEDPVRQVFSLDWVQILLHQSRYVRPLEYYIMLDPPKHTHSLLDVDVCCRDMYTSAYGTYCGMPIVLRHNGQTRNVTLGGVVKATYGSGSTQMFGMIPEHAVRELMVSTTSTVELSNATGARKEGAFDLTTWLPHDVTLGRPIALQSLPGVAAKRAHPNYDWCLLELQSPLPNLAINAASQSGDDASHEILMAQEPVFHEGTSDSVLLLGASGGTRRGTLSSTKGRIWLAHTASFVDAYLLELDDDTVRAGDSGGWVVHSAANDLYGHVVATDAFGDAYVLPALDTFENMRACLGASSVSLPTLHELQGTRPTFNEKHAAQTEQSTSLPFNKTYNPNQSPPTPRMTSRPLRVRQKGNEGTTGRSIRSARKQSTGNRKHNMSKSWRPITASRQVPTYDPKYVDVLHEHGVECDLLQAFLQPCGNVIPDFECEAIQRLCTATSSTLKPEPDAFGTYLDYQIQYAGTNTLRQVYSQLMTANQLRQYLSQLKPLPPADHQAHRKMHSEAKVKAARQLIYVDKLDRKIIQALLETVRYNHVDALANAIRKHVTRQTRLKVTVREIGMPNFQLELHLPYFALRKSHDCQAKTIPTQQRQWTDLKFISESPKGLFSESYTVTEAHHAVVISGTCNNQWVAYAFSDQDVLHQSQDDESADDESADEDEEPPEEDLFQTANCGGSFNSEGIWDPRKYFLIVCAKRMELVSREYTYLVSMFERALEDLGNDLHVSRHSATKRLKGHEMPEFLGKLRHILPLLSHDLVSITNTLDAFLEPAGDLSYFSDITDKLALFQRGLLSETEIRLKALGHKLDLIKRMAEDLETALANQAQFENYQVARRSLEISLACNELSRSSTELALGSFHISKERARTTKVNLYLLLITTPVVLVLQYFGTEQPIFSFSRNSTSFLIAVMVLIFALPLLRLLIQFIEMNREKAVSAALRKFGRQGPVNGAADGRYDANSSEKVLIDC